MCAWSVSGPNSALVAVASARPASIDNASSASRCAGFRLLARCGVALRLSRRGRTTARMIHPARMHVPRHSAINRTAGRRADKTARWLAGAVADWANAKTHRLGLPIDTKAGKSFNMAESLMLTWRRKGPNKMPQNILQRILETKAKEVQALKDEVGLEALKARAKDAPRARNFYIAVTKKPRGLLNLIAEIKKASPSAGVICEDYDPVAQGLAYADAGANALSVLTDNEYFRGSLDHFRAVREAVHLPMLRKDFIIDPIQVYESRAAGADAILLIAAALPPARLLDLMILATELRMTSLIEVHSAKELLEVRSAVGFPHRAYGLLGINNRDLKSFRVDIKNTLHLAELAGDEVPIISESGIRTHDDVQRLAERGVSAILVGETLMRSGDIKATIAELLGR